MRRSEIARLAGVPASDVQEVSADQVRQALTDRAAGVVLDVATQQPATYWKVGTRYFLDDPEFGDVVDIADLGYDAELGLHKRQD